MLLKLVLPQNRHGLGVLVKYRHPAVKSMSVNA